MSTDVVVYHHPCADGFTSAWVARMALPGAAYLSATYNDKFKAPLLSMVDQDTIVWFVDFSADRQYLLDLCTKAKRVMVLDHHKTAAAALDSGNEWPDNFRCVFDMSRSGARITWDYFNPGKRPPPLVSYVMDRDLWQFKMAESRAVSEYIASIPMDFGSWDRLDATLSWDLEAVIAHGQTLQRNLDRMVDRVRPHVMLRNVGGHLVPVVNSAHAVSEIGHLLCADYPFALIWSVDSDGYAICSLRSAGGFDASKIAASFGGGGHPSACGFRMPLTKFCEILHAAPAE
jgi:oligoribonuclease NrnB/cAMP/cGMP phosphodiesterase (DHH superfamily)